MEGNAARRAGLHSKQAAEQGKKSKGEKLAGSYLHGGHERVDLRPAHHEFLVGPLPKVGVPPDHVRQAEGVPQQPAHPTCATPLDMPVYS